VTAPVRSKRERGAFLAEIHEVGRRPPKTFAATLPGLSGQVHDSRTFYLTVRLRNGNPPLLALRAEVSSEVARRQASFGPDLFVRARGRGAGARCRRPNVGGPTPPAPLPGRSEPVRSAGFQLDTGHDSRAPSLGAAVTRPSVCSQIGEERKERMPTCAAAPRAGASCAPDELPTVAASACSNLGADRSDSEISAPSSTHHRPTSWPWGASRAGSVTQTADGEVRWAPFMRCTLSGTHRRYTTVQVGRHTVGWGPRSTKRAIERSTAIHAGFEEASMRAEQNIDLLVMRGRPGADYVAANSVAAQDLA